MGGNGKGKFVRYGITCTAGLLVNMVRKTMEFVEPELPSEEYLKGYSVRETLTFADAGEFEAGMKRLFRTWAREKLPEDRPLYFNAACRIAEKEEAVEFWGDCVGCSIAKEEDFLQAVRLVREGPISLEELCRTLSVKDRRAFLLRQKFQYLYEKGCVRWSGHSRLFCLRHNGRLYYRASNLVGADGGRHGRFICFSLSKES